MPNKWLKTTTCLLILLGSLSFGGCLEVYEDPLKTLIVSEAEVKIYFDPQPTFYYPDAYKCRTPNPDKHRIVEYRIGSIKNVGYKEKKFVTVEPIVDAFKELIITGEPVSDSVPLGPGGFMRGLHRFLVEGNPEEIKRLASQTQVKIVWEERGSKWVKHVPVRSVEETEAKPVKNVVNIYSARYEGMEMIIREFAREKGIEVTFTIGTDAGLRERIKAQGLCTIADVYLAEDAGNLWLAAQEGLISPVVSQVLLDNIPANLRDPENRWFGLTQRVSTIMYHPDRVSPEELSTYEALANPKWRGRLVLRPATNAYTQSLVASLISAHGRRRAAEIVRGWVANKPTLIESETQILKTLATGGGDVAIANHHCLAHLLEANPNFPVCIFWANQGNRGAHINISGAGVITHTKNRENAIAFLEWLSSPRGQKLLADSNYEFPANPNVKPHPIIAGFGNFFADPIDMTEFGRLQAEAIKLLNETGYK